MRPLTTGALVEVTLIGEVTALDGDRGFWLKSGVGANATSHWIHAITPLKVLRPARPKEVLLLACGHVINEPNRPGPAERPYCSRCMTRQDIEAVGGVAW